MRNRPTGYYWIIFPHTNGQRRWEPGSWDASVGLWALIGSKDLWLDVQLTIGPALTAPPPPLPAKATPQ